MLLGVVLITPIPTFTGNPNHPKQPQALVLYTVHSLNSWLGSAPSSSRWLFDSQPNRIGRQECIAELQQKGFKVGGVHQQTRETTIPRDGRSGRRTVSQ